MHHYYKSIYIFHECNVHRINNFDHYYNLLDIHFHSKHDSVDIHHLLNKLLVHICIQLLHFQRDNQGKYMFLYDFEQYNLHLIHMQLVLRMDLYISVQYKLNYQRNLNLIYNRKHK